MNPFFQDEDELIAQNGMAPGLQVAPPQEQQTPPPQMMPPQFSRQQSIFDNPEFQKLQQLLTSKPSVYDRQQLAEQENGLRHRALYDDLASIASGGHPASSLEVDKMIADKLNHQKFDKINTYKSLLDIYGNLQNSQLTNDQKKLATYNSYLDTTPGSPKAQANAENFKNGIDHYQALMRQNADMVGMKKEDLQAQLDNLNKYKTNVDKMSYAQQEKLISDLDKKMNQAIGSARNFSNVQQGSVAAALNERKETAQEKKDREMTAMGWKKLSLEEQAALDRKQSKLESGKEKELANDEKEWEKLGKAMNPDAGHTRDILGRAKDTINRFKRLEKIMNNPKGMTSQDYNIAAADLASMVTGGAPTVSATEESKYDTLKARAADIWQKLKSNPAYINTPGIKEHILENGREMANVARESIASNSRQAKLAHEKLIKKSDPNKFRFAKMHAESLGEGVMVDKAVKALDDPNASDETKKAAKQIIDHYAGE